MHDSRKIFLLDDDKIPMVLTASYNPVDSDGNVIRTGSGNPFPNNIVEFKTYDRSLKRGDYIAVPTKSRHGMTVCQVVDTDVQPDFKSHQEITWVIGRIDKGPYEEFTAQEQKFIEAANAATRRREQKQLQEDLLADMDTEGMMLIGSSAEEDE